MNYGDISDSLFCAGMACASDLLEVKYQKKVHKVGVEWRDLPTEDAFRRPLLHEIDVYSFPQVWSDTALGFGGVGGQSMTTAQTTVVIGMMHDAAIYFGRRLAYHISKPNTELMKDICAHNMASCAGRGKYNEV